MTPDSCNNALLHLVSNAASWFDPVRAGMVGHIVYALDRPGVVLVVIGRCAGHPKPDGTVERCGRLFYSKRLFVPLEPVTAEEVRREMRRLAFELRRWIEATPPHHDLGRPSVEERPQGDSQ